MNSDSPQPHSVKRPRPDSPPNSHCSLTKPRLVTTSNEPLCHEGLEPEMNPLVEIPQDLVVMPTDQKISEKTPKPIRRRPKLGTYTEISYHPGLPEDFPPWLIG